MLLDPIHFVVVVVAILVVMVVISLICMVIYDRHNREATEYLQGRLTSYRASSTYCGEVTALVTQEVFRELYGIPWAPTMAEPRWYDEYAQLLAFFLAICEDHEAQVSLIYGSLNETRRKCQYPYKQLIWMEYTYDNRDWVLWVDPDRVAPDGSLLRNDGYKMFREFGQIYSHATYGRHEVCRIFNKYNHRSN